MESYSLCLQSFRSSVDIPPGDPRSTGLQFSFSHFEEPEFLVFQKFFIFLRAPYINTLGVLNTFCLLTKPAGTSL